MTITSSKPERATAVPSRDRPTAALTASRGYLSDEPRVVGDPETIGVRSISYLERDAPSHVRGFEAANLLSLGLFRARRAADARELISLELEWAATWQRSRWWHEVVALAMQPQVNLLRMAGHAGDFDTALAGYAQLSLIARERYGSLPYGPSSLGDWKAARRWPFVVSLVRDATISDTCKMLLRRGDADTLLEHAQELRNCWHTSGGRGAQHAEETPWLLGRAEDPEPLLARLAVTDEVQQTSFVQLLHWGRCHAAEPAGKLALKALHRCWDKMATAGNQSPLTSLRIRIVLAEALLSAGHADAAAQHLEAASLAARTVPPDPAAIAALGLLHGASLDDLLVPPGPSGSLDEAFERVTTYLRQPSSDRSRQ